MSYTLRTQVDGEFDDVVAETIDALEEEGFGVLCDIDVQETLKKKLDEDFRQYRILGACNPQLAHQGLENDLELGTLLPCNVVVYDDDDGVVVSAVDPQRLIAVAENDDVDPIGDDAYERFERVLESL
ncbi:DUF302 domain-containing protein [Natrinema versiforme]|uniref:DUF302 domain-containing protein n=1 Tax=Natrinema versiforme JCM 10478 TaxID=1227496 RepID=L9Y0B2_9EURY|nr:DUF302 domain-containing protein [Natrinema versiforme]ELY66313.1 hypothetical protein C489_13176 [Natrinema versiforme JCM 10478]